MFAGPLMLVATKIMLALLILIIVVRTAIFVISYITRGDSGDPDNCLFVNFINVVTAKRGEFRHSMLALLGGFALEKNPGACLIDVIVVCGFLGVLLAWKVILLASATLGLMIFIVHHAHERRKRLNKFVDKLDGRK